MKQHNILNLEHDINDSNTLVMVSDYDCPWCYFALGVLKTITEKYHLNVVRYPFQILPQVDSVKGMLVEDYMKLTGTSASERAERDKVIEHYTQKYELYWFPRTHFYQSKPALILSLWAMFEGFGGEAFHRAVYYAEYKDNLNIAKRDVLKDIIKTQGGPVDQVDFILDNSPYTKLFEKLVLQVRSLNIQGVPYFVYKKRALPGFVDVPHMENFINNSL